MEPLTLTGWSLPEEPTEASLTIPAGVLVPAMTYEFILDATEGEQSNSITITVVVAEIPTPAIVSQKFADSMGRITCVFSADTNSPIGCQSMFDNETVAALGFGAVCVWESPSSLAVLFGDAFTLAADASLIWRGGVLRSADGYSEAMPRTATSIAPAASPPKPVAEITGSTVIGACADLELDGGTSSGNAGRPLSYAWAVVPSAYLTKMRPEEYEPINQYLDTQRSAILFVPDDILPNGRSYKMELTVTNWLLATQSAFFVVEKSAVALHQVRSKGSSTRVVQADADLLAKIIVLPSACSSLPKFNYLWQLVDDGSSDLSFIIPNASLSTESFFIPRSSFTPGHNYHFQVTVSASDNPALQNTADLYVRVLASPLVVSLAGGDRAFSTGWEVPLVIDGSASRDPDVVAAGVDMELQVEWECHVAPSGGLCFNPQDLNSFIDGLQLTVPPQQLRASEKGESLTFTLRLQKQARVAEAVVHITVINAVVPEVFITTNLRNAKHSSDNTLRLVANVADSSATAENFRFQWSIATSNFDLSDRSRLRSSPTSRLLVIPPHQFLPGATYVFNLEVYSNSSATPGSASATVVVNAPPSRGTCRCDPPVGVALNTSFLLTCEDYTDDGTDLPLQYSFGLAQEDARADLTLWQTSNNARAPLPSGNHTLVGQVRDRFGAVAEYRFDVEVMPSEEGVGPALQMLKEATEVGF